MKRRIFAVMMMIGCAFLSHAQNSMTHDLAYASSSVNDPKADDGVSIYPTVVTTELNIAITDKLAGGKLTVTCFNSVGEIVLETVLGIGVNKIDTRMMAKGSYVAVVRKNDKYQTKSSFEVK